MPLTARERRFQDDVRASATVPALMKLATAPTGDFHERVLDFTKDGAAYRAIPESSRPQYLSAIATLFQRLVKEPTPKELADARTLCLDFAAAVDRELATLADGDHRNRLQSFVSIVAKGEHPTVHKLPSDPLKRLSIYFKEQMGIDDSERRTAIRMALDAGSKTPEIALTLGVCNDCVAWMCLTQAYRLPNPIHEAARVGRTSLGDVQARFGLGDASNALLQDAAVGIGTAAGATRSEASMHFSNLVKAMDDHDDQALAAERRRMADRGVSADRIEALVAECRPHTRDAIAEMERRWTSLGRFRG